jgi:hypothetical protein
MSTMNKNKEAKNMYNTLREKPGKKKTKLIGCIAIGGIAIVAVAIALFVFRGCMSFSLFSSEAKIARVFTDNTEWIRKVSELVLCQRQTNETVGDSEVRMQNVVVPFWKTFKIPSQANYEIRFKVVYSYIVSADRDKWSFDLDDNVLRVTAPPIGVIQPPGIFTDSIKARYEGGWLVTGEKAKLEEMKKALSSIATEKALDAKHISVVRETCRKSLEDFIWKWLAEKCAYEIKAITVTFADEEQSRYGGMGRASKKEGMPKL